jgi:hypothetical protein
MADVFPANPLGIRIDRALAKLLKHDWLAPAADRALTELDHFVGRKRPPTFGTQHPSRNGCGARWKFRGGHLTMRYPTGHAFTPDQRVRRDDSPFNQAIKLDRIDRSVLPVTDCVVPVHGIPWKDWRTAGAYRNVSGKNQPRFQRPPPVQSPPSNSPARAANRYHYYSNYSDGKLNEGGDSTLSPPSPRPSPSKEREI